MREVGGLVFKKFSLSVFLVFPLLFLLSFSSQSVAESCPDAEVFGESLLTKFCWDCIFPMRINGIKMSPPSGEGSGSIPAGALSSLVCSCDDDLGVPQFGAPLSGWFPRFITETVQKPYCSPTLMGKEIGPGSRVSVGGDVSSTKSDKKSRVVSDTAFLHFHTLSFPILEMMELLMSGDCNPDKFVDVDLQYISEPDPLWNDNLLSALLTPETFLFTNPGAMALCAAECNANTISAETLDFNWCAGCWGGVYPFNGFANHNGSRVKHSSLIATKALAALHRRGLAHKTFGRKAACEPEFSPYLIKKQYRFSMMYPTQEKHKNHRIGESTMFWGENKQKAAAGSNHVYVGFRYQDCCVLL